jgi:uncharacterized membrane-anchored protein
MKKILVLFFLSAFIFPTLWAKKDKPNPKEKESIELDSVTLNLLSRISNLKFQTEGKVTIADGRTQIQIPAGFKYLDKEQSHFVVEEYWGNPKQELEGMLFLKEANILDTALWAFIIEYESNGHIDDSDAKELNYTELMVEMKKSTTEANAERIKMGYLKIELIGWASAPFYDSANKTLHWAKELSFNDDEVHTLNYDVRILGRDGLISLNAIGGMDNLEEVKNKIPEILSAVKFTNGNEYRDFDPSVDKVAAVGIGGLVAGHVLAKAGFFVVILKYIKVIALAVIGGGTWIWRKITGRGGEE